MLTFAPSLLMPEMKLYYMDDPLLREMSTDVKAVDRELIEYCERMYDFMEMLRGAGLAAPQVGRLERFIIVHRSILPAPGDEVLINPVITFESNEAVTDEEGCLSFLSIAENVTRPAAVTVEYMDLEGERKKMEAEGLLARAILHEIDHLDGVLFVDHLSRLKRKLVKDRVRKKLRELEAEDKAAHIKK
jgi:peptide deformylase